MISGKLSEFPGKRSEISVKPSDFSEFSKQDILWRIFRKLWKNPLKNPHPKNVSKITKLITHEIYCVSYY